MSVPLPTDIRGGVSHVGQRSTVTSHGVENPDFTWQVEHGRPPHLSPAASQGTHKDNNLNLLAFSIDANVYDRLGLVLLFSVYTFVVAFTYVHEHM